MIKLSLCDEALKKLNLSEGAHADTEKWLADCAGIINGLGINPWLYLNTELVDIEVLRNSQSINPGNSETEPKTDGLN